MSLTDSRIKLAHSKGQLLSHLSSPRSPSWPLSPKWYMFPRTSDTHPQKILSSGAPGSTTPQPQCPGPTAPLPAARQPSAGPWHTPAPALSSRPAALLGEKKRVRIAARANRPKGGPHRPTPGGNDRTEDLSRPPQEPLKPPCPILGAEIESPHTWPQPLLLQRTMESP